ncbi:unnamed protein product [Effrenium voratum]|nr:unnamed protein product [Effrenium voratum]
MSVRLARVLCALLVCANSVRPSGREEELTVARRSAFHLKGGEKCEEDARAPADPTEACPTSCPFSAELANPEKFCHFKCVTAKECGTGDLMHNQTIPERKKVKENPYCRFCEVEACAECVASNPGDGVVVETCKKCMLGYTLTEDGKECESHGDDVFIGIAAVGVFFGIVGLIWYLIVLSKPVVNEDGVKYAMESQKRMMVTQDHHGEEGQPYPFGTNLMSTTVAGPGTTALFSFQGAVMLWGAIVIGIWLGFVCFVSKDLLFLGNRPATTPRQLCEVVAWGRQRQMELIWTKVSWIASAYVLGTVGAIVYGMRMATYFKKFDSERSTLSDYVAVLDGVPRMKGDQVEADLKKVIKDLVGAELAEEVVAVSVGWDFSAHRAQVAHFIDEQIAPFHEANGEPLHIPEGAGDELSGFAGAITKKVLDKWHIHLDGHGHEFTEEDLKKTLQEMETAPVSYVIFMTEGARDKAVEAAQAGVKVQDVVCTLRPETYEPEALFWHNLHVTPEGRGGKYMSASVNILLVCLAWTVLLYLPYAHYMATFSYANGDEPSFLAESVFIGLVVGAQTGLFVASSLGADFCQCHYEDQKHKVYIVFYNAALILNLIMDIVLQGYLSYLQMVGVGARVADGRLLGSLSSFQEIFESYPMQKSVGKLLFKYCWPCTFLVPFIAEPFVAQLGPYHIGTLLIRSNVRVRGENAERALELSEMEQGRYADVIFNLILVACIPFIAPAYMLMTYGTFMISHIYIYFYDHWKTLRWARKFYFSSDEVHWFGQQLLCLPLGLLASALVFKVNQMSGGVHGGLGAGVLKGQTLGLAMCGAFVAHVVIHLTLLNLVVKPCREDSEKEENKTPFSEVAKQEAATHLSTNPIQCLRSKYILKEEPPLSPFMLGKEQIMVPNEKLGAFYNGAKELQAKEKRKSQYSQEMAGRRRIDNDTLAVGGQQSMSEEF